MKHDWSLRWGCGSEVVRIFLLFAGTVSYPEAIYGADAFEYTADEMPAPVVPTFQPNTLLQRGTVYIAALAALTAAGVWAQDIAFHR